VTRKNIVRMIAEELGLPQLQTQQTVQKTFDAIINALVTERRVELRNFGVFEVKWRKSRIARNPRTGEKVVVPVRCGVGFQPGRLMQELVKEENRSMATD
jgi:integration host factor subunit beta